MSSIDLPGDAIDPAPELVARARRSRVKRILVSFGVTTILGFALAGWYVGGRIFAIEKVHAAPAPKTLTAVPVPAAPVAQAEAAPIPLAEPKPAEPKPAEPNPAGAAPSWNAVDPQAGETYIQLAALGPHSTTDYLQALAGWGLHPRIAPGPSANLYRILIGPYPDKTAREKEQQDLQAAGIETIVRVY